MPNIHTPERLADEQPDEYKVRRMLARQAVRAMRLHGITNGGPSARESLRDHQRRNGHGPRATYGAGLVRPEQRRQQARMQRLHPLRGDHGAYTLAGSRQRDPFPGTTAQHLEGVQFRRIWLAGISAQRGF